jgi:hypothetical protein
LGTQVIALILSVYGVVGDSRVEGIGWVNGIIIIAIALITFVLVDLVKVFTIRLWNRYHNTTSVIVKPKPTLKTLINKNSKKSTRAHQFTQDHALNWSENNEGHRAY